MTNGPPSAERNGPGWLVARHDGTIVVADRPLAALLGLPDAHALVGQVWTSFIAPVDAWRLDELRSAEHAGVPWSGALTVVTAHGDERVDVELFPAGPPSGDLTVIRLNRTAPEPPLSRAASAAEPPDDVAVLLAAIEAGEDAIDAPSGARAILQAVHTGLAFDWGVVLRFGDGDAEVVATYPAPMAGMERGTRWEPLDDAERILRESGEPSIDGALVRRFHERSPLARLVAFGMRSRIQIPVFVADVVRGCISLYSTRPRAFAAVDGVRLERFARPLRAQLDPQERTQAVPLSAPPPTSTRSVSPPAPAPGPAPSTAPPASEPTPPAGGGTGAPPEGSPPAERPSVEPPPDERPPEEQPPDQQPPDQQPPDQQRRAEAPAPAERGRWEAGPRDRAEIVERRLGALGEMVSGVAHELNNPLTAILGYAQILPSLDGRDREQALATIEQEALRASRIVRNLLAFARQHRTTVRPIDVEAILRRVVDVRRRSLSDDHVTVETHFAGLPPVTADEYQLEQVFLNLINNAYQAMLPGGGTLTLTTEAQNGMVRVLVSDTGPGVPEEVADRIFEPFFTTRDVGAGAGLGLAIVYGIVAEHAGHVWVERSLAGGAQFVVELPRAPEGTVIPPRDPQPARATEATRPAPPASPAAEPAADRRRVLVIDDELPIRALTNEILSAAGYAVDTAASGEEALRALESTPYDAVIADMRLPALAGDALYDVISGRWPQLRSRVLFITGDPEADRDAEQLDERGARHLEKPFDTQTLLRAVRDLLAVPIE